MSRRQNIAIDLGTLGEDEFKRLCSLNGLIANASINDKMGWDFLVEGMSYTPSTTLLDSYPFLQKSLFQVKSTKSNVGSVRGKLSAFKHLADTDLPAFITHHVFDSGYNIQKIRVLHIGRNQITAILSRVRKVESEGRIDLHKIIISLPLDEAITINPEGDNLIDAISQGIHVFGPSYGKVKMDFRVACGFDQNSISASFSFDRGIYVDDLVDLMLGIKGELPISRMIVQKSRFGISFYEDEDHIQDGSMSVQIKPFQTGYIRAVSQDGFRRAELLSELFTPNIPGLEPENFRVRIKNDVFDAVLHLGGGTSQMSFSVDTKQIFELGLLSDILNFGTLLCEDGTKIFADFPALKNIEMPIPPDFMKVWRWRLAAEFLNFISPAQHKNLKKITLSSCLEEVEYAIDSNRSAFAALARSELKITSEKHSSFNDDVSSFGSAFIPIVINFQDYVYQAIARADATWEDKLNGSIEIELQKPIVIFDDFICLSDFHCEPLNELSSRLSSAQGGRGRFSISLEVGNGSENDEDGIDEVEI